MTLHSSARGGKSSKLIGGWLTSFSLNVYTDIEVNAILECQAMGKFLTQVNVAIQTLDELNSSKITLVFVLFSLVSDTP